MGQVGGRAEDVPPPQRSRVKGRCPLSGFQRVKPFGGFGQTQAPAQRKAQASEQPRSGDEASGGSALRKRCALHIKRSVQRMTARFFSLS